MRVEETVWKKKKKKQEHPSINLKAIDFLVVDRKQRPKNK